MHGKQGLEHDADDWWNGRHTAACCPPPTSGSLSRLVTSSWMRTPGNALRSTCMPAGMAAGGQGEGRGPNPITADSVRRQVAQRAATRGGGGVAQTKRHPGALPCQAAAWVAVAHQQQLVAGLQGHRRACRSAITCSET
jgi:hypothetical protein